MKIYAIANQKGGCAKTTTVVNLAAALARLEKKVVVLDLDPQRNSSSWLGVPSSNDGAFKLLTNNQFDASTIVSPSNAKNIQALGGSQNMAILEEFIPSINLTSSYFIQALSKIKNIEADVVLIDTPPTLNSLTLAAIYVSDELLIPVTTHIMTLEGVAQLLEAIARFDFKNGRSQPVPYSFIASRVDLRTRHSREVLESLREKFGVKVLKTVIRENIRLAEAPSFRESIFEYEKKSAAAEDFSQLANELTSNIAGI
jgi:chromosome partitioning protein